MTTDRNPIDAGRGDPLEKGGVSGPAEHPLDAGTGRRARSDPTGTSASHPGKPDPVDTGWEGGSARSQEAARQAARTGEDSQAGAAQPADDTGSLSPLPATFADGVGSAAAPDGHEEDGEPDENRAPAGTGQEPVQRASRRPWVFAGLLLGLGAAFMATRRSHSRRGVA